MSDPKRLLDPASDASDRERRLLGDAIGAEPPAGLADATWAAISAILPPVPEGPAAGGPAEPAGGASPPGAAGAGAAAAVAKVVTAKWVIAAALAGATALGGYAVWAPQKPGVPTVQATPSGVIPASIPTMAPGAEPSGVRAAAAPAVAAVPVAAVPIPPVSVSAAPVNAPAPQVMPSTTLMPGVPTARSQTSQTVPSAPGAQTGPSALSASSASSATYAGGDLTAPGEPRAVPTVSTPAERISHLHEESELLGRARDAMRTDDPARALVILNDARARFPDGALAQEREALTIEGLWKSGDRATAASRAQAFVRAYPSSPLASRMREFLR